MCGIAGIVNFKRNIDIHDIMQMNYALRYRGPDDEGYVFINRKSNHYKEASGVDTHNLFIQNFQQIKEIAFNADVVFAHRRLGILGQFSQSHQPMSSPDKKTWVTFNGEIYNYKELYRILDDKGYNFSTDSDTEVLINSYREWGTDCVSKFNGIWSFALWDLSANLLFCSRDRFGVKPFYYYYDKIA